jgi:TPR repeat protein
MMSLGRIYEQGIGTKVDLEKAYAYYDMAAELNESYAYCWLGKACELGLHPDFKGIPRM